MRKINLILLINIVLLLQLNILAMDNSLELHTPTMADVLNLLPEEIDNIDNNETNNIVENSSKRVMVTEEEQVQPEPQQNIILDALRQYLLEGHEEINYNHQQPVQPLQPGTYESSIQNNKQKRRQKKSPEKYEHLLVSVIDLKCYWENCNWTFNNGHELKNHIRTEHLTNDYLTNRDSKCKWTTCHNTSVGQNITGEIHVKRGALLNHILDHFMSYTCLLCNSKFKYKNISEHFKRHEKNNPEAKTNEIKEKPKFTYIRCEKYKKTLQRHENENLTCYWEGCNQTFTDQSQLDIHARNHAKEFDKNENLVCKWLGCKAYNNNNFASPNNLRTHIIHLHTGKIYKCECGYYTRYKRSFDDHKIFKHKQKNN